MALLSRSTRRAVAPALWLALPFGASLAAQTPPPPLPVARGFADRTRFVEVANPLGLSGVAGGTAPGELWFAVDHLLYRLDAQDLPHVEFQLPFGQRVGFVHRPRGRHELLFADATNDALHVRDLGTGAETVRPIPPNAFDVAVTAAGDTLVSANPTWPLAGAHTGIWCLDPTGGSAHREVVALTGPSGPLAIDPRSGDLLYATQPASYPAAHGSVQLLRFPASRLAGAIAGGAPLTANDAQIVAAALDGAYDLEFDDRGSLYVSDPQNGGVIRFLPNGRRDPVPVVDPAREVITALAFGDGSAATFDPFQPGDAGTLFVLTADWASLATVREIRPARATIDAPFGTTAPPGPVRITADGLPAGQPLLWIASGLPPLPSERRLLDVSAVPVWSALQFTLPTVSWWATADATGHAQVDFQSAGGQGWPITFEAAAMTDPARGELLLTTTPSISITLLP